MRGKTLAAQGKRTRSAKIKHIYSSFRGVNKFPRTSLEGCIAVPFALTACIPQEAIRKFAAKEPFTVHVHEVSGAERFVLYFGDSHE